MHKYRAILEVHNGKLTIDEAAFLLRTKPRFVKQLMTLKTQEQLKHLVPVIDKLTEPVNTQADQTKLRLKIAELSGGVTIREVNRILQRIGVTVPPPLSTVTRLKKHEAAVHALQSRYYASFDVIAGLMAAADAAEEAECTKRHIYRLCGDLLAQDGYEFIDLRRMTLVRRKELAEKYREQWKNDKQERESSERKQTQG